MRRCQDIAGLARCACASATARRARPAMRRSPRRCSPGARAPPRPPPTRQVHHGGDASVHVCTRHQSGIVSERRPRNFRGGRSIFRDHPSRRSCSVAVAAAPASWQLCRPWGRRLVAWARWGHRLAPPSGVASWGSGASRWWLSGLAVGVGRFRGGAGLRGSRACAAPRAWLKTSTTYVAELQKSCSAGARAHVCV